MNGLNLFSITSGLSGMIIMGLVVVVVLIFIIISSITGKKARKKEQEKRKKIVKDEIKRYLASIDNQRNISVEFEKVFARKGPEYRYRDVFDVIVRILSPKDNSVLSTRSYEIEGITTKVNKKEYKTEWIVNKETNIEDTRKNIAVAEKKVKLTREERAEYKKRDKDFIRKNREVEKDKLQKEREEYKKRKNDKSTLRAYEKKSELRKVDKITKFVPERKK